MTVFVPRERDLISLEILDMRENEGMTALQISKRLGITRNSVVGILHRISATEDPHKVGEGTMPRRWWAK